MKTYRHIKSAYAENFNWTIDDIINDLILMLYALNEDIEKHTRRGEFIADDWTTEYIAEYNTMKIYRFPKIK